MATGQGGSWIIYTANACNSIALAYAHFFALDVRREIGHNWPQADGRDIGKKGVFLHDVLMIARRTWVKCLSATTVGFKVQLEVSAEVEWAKDRTAHFIRGPNSI